MVSSVISLTMAASTFIEIRCAQCARLLLKWDARGTATLNVKCPRCGRIDTLGLSTSR